MPRYECDHCGACCRGTLIVEAYELDVLREPLLLTADYAKRYESMTTEEIRRHLEQEDACLIIAGSKPCKFLGTDSLCSIYSTRPNVCVAMQAGDEQCQQARQAVGLAELPPSPSA